MKMSKSKSGKSHEIISDNPKMDTSGMAGKPRPLEAYEWKPPAMTLNDMLQVRAQQTNKKPEVE